MTREELIALLKEENRKRRQVNHVIRFVIGLTYVCSAWLIVSDWLAGNRFEFMHLLPVILLSGGIVAGATSGIRIASEAARRISDPIVLPDLVELLDISESDILPLVRSAVIACASQLSGLEPIRFTPNQLQRLVQASLVAGQSDFSMACLRILSKFGGEAELKTLPSLATGPTESAALMAMADIRLRLAQAHIRPSIDSSSGVKAVHS
jgi:hypothetical protein